MKKRIYPWGLATATLTVFAGFFGFYFSTLYSTTAARPINGILPAMAWTSSEAFVFFVVAVWIFAAVCGVIVAVLADLFFGHMSTPTERPAAIPLAMKRAA